uniref:Uncharacterized protein n=1 Tax=Romanomermis culicivorax TaxID=13658 RepID=A0A915HR39_ROMCU
MIDAAKTKKNNTKKVDFETFCSLCADYYFSNDPATIAWIKNQLKFSTVRNSIDAVTLRKKLSFVCDVAPVDEL